MNKLIMFILLASVVGCGIKAHRGSFDYVAPNELKSSLEILSKNTVRGKACFGATSIVTGMPLHDNVIERSIEDALSKFEGATTLAKMNFEDKGYCLYTVGYPARIKN